MKAHTSSHSSPLQTRPQFPSLRRTQCGAFAMAWCEHAREMCNMQEQWQEEKEQSNNYPCILQKQK